MLRKHKEPDIRRHWEWLTVNSMLGALTPKKEQHEKSDG